MKKNIILNTIVMALLVVFTSSCKKDIEAGGTAVEKLSGDFRVKVAGTGSYFTLSTFNTSANSSTEMWIQSTGLRAGTLLIGIKGKISANVSDQTFSATNATNVATTTSTTIPTFSIANGRVVSNGTFGPVSKTPSDLISFDLTVNGVVYKVEGFHKTGFMEDDELTQ